MFTAIAAGYRLIDTARSYGVEQEVGQGVRRAIDAGLCRREEILVSTKVWMTEFRKERLLAAAKLSNESLGLEYIDLLLLHLT